jgi:hypothetical protein
MLLNSYQESKVFSLNTFQFESHFHIKENDYCDISIINCLIIAQSKIEREFF